MNPQQAYQSVQHAAPPHIEVVLTWFEQVMHRLDQCQRQPDQSSRPQWLAETRLLLGGLIAGLNSAASPLEANFFRLYEYVLHLLNDPTPSRLAEAQELLGTVRESFVAIREQAVTLERSGALSSRINSSAVSVVA